MKAEKWWQAIKIIAPNETESNKAEFNTKCDSPVTAKTLRFDKASYAEVRTTWRLGGTGVSSEERWVAIKIVSPSEMESNHAKLIVICSPR